MTRRFATLLIASALRAESPTPVGKEHTYKRADGRDLRLHVVSPDAPGSSAHPALVLFHGGGWKGGRPSQFNSQAEHFAQRGMVVIQPEYRLVGKDTTEAPVPCIQDAKSAMRWVRAHARELRIDPRRIASGGGSAGGHLAAFVGMMDGMDDPQDDLRVSARSNAMILFNPVFDNGPGGWGHERTGERYREFSPFHNVSADDPPALVLSGADDELIPARTVLAFAAAMKKAGVRCEAVVYPGEAHGFFNPSQNGGRGYRPTLQAADEFLVSLGWLKPAAAK